MFGLDVGKRPYPGEKKEKLASICEYICKNYEELKKEISSVRNMLCVIEGLAMAYLNEPLIEMHSEYRNIVISTAVLSKVADEVECVQKGAKDEFLQGIDFCNIAHDLNSINERSELIFFIWKAKKTLDYIAYQIDRIKNTTYLTKQVAILKGMIAYY